MCDKNCLHPDADFFLAELDRQAEEHERSDAGESLMYELLASSPTGAQTSGWLTSGTFEAAQQRAKKVYGSIWPSVLVSDSATGDVVDVGYAQARMNAEEKK